MDPLLNLPDSLYLGATSAGSAALDSAGGVTATSGGSQGGHSNGHTNAGGSSNSHYISGFDYSDWIHAPATAQYEQSPQHAPPLQLQTDSNTASALATFSSAPFNGRASSSRYMGLAVHALPDHMQPSHHFSPPGPLLRSHVSTHSSGEPFGHGSPTGSATDLSQYITSQPALPPPSVRHSPPAGPTTRRAAQVQSYSPFAGAHSPPVSPRNTTLIYPSSEQSAGKRSEPVAKPSHATPAPPRTRRAAANASKRGGGAAPSGGSAASKNLRTPQADESVPEAALHLLRLALPSGSTGSVATNATLDDDERSIEEDLERETVATSVHSDDGHPAKVATAAAPSKGKARTRAQRQSAADLSPSQMLVHPEYLGTDGMLNWRHAEDQPPLQLQSTTARASPRPGSGRASVTSSVTSGRGRQHRPARSQGKKASPMSVSAAEQTDGPTTGRRTSSRVRRPVATQSPVIIESDDSAAEDVDDVDADPDVTGNASDLDVAPARKRKGSTSVNKGKGKAKAVEPALTTPSRDGPSKPGPKRLSDVSAFNPTPPKKPRSSIASASTSNNGDNMSVTSSVRRGRRAPIVPTNYVYRSLPADMPILDGFRRFYRAFPISAAFPPDSHMCQGHGLLPAVMSAPSSAFQQDGMFDPFLHSPFVGQAPAPVASGSNVVVPYDTDQGAVEPPVEYVDRVNGDPAQFFVELPEGAKWNKPGDPFNLYNPRIVKGTKDDKLGLCPICIEPVERGGAGEEKWLKVRRLRVDGCSEAVVCGIDTSPSSASSSSRTAAMSITCLMRMVFPISRVS